MRNGQDREGSISYRTFAIIAVAFMLAVAIILWGPWSTEHVASNPGPSGTPGSTALDQTPPPAASPLSGTTTGETFWPRHDHCDVSSASHQRLLQNRACAARLEQTRMAGALRAPFLKRPVL